MQIGAMNHPGKDPVAEIRWIGENGFDFVDLTLEPPAVDPEGIDIEAVRSALTRFQLGVVTHTAPFIPIASPFKIIRNATLEEFRRSLKVSRQLEAKLLNVHLGKLPSHFTQKNAVDWHAETLFPLCEEAAHQGIRIILEHIPFGGTNQLETIVTILDRVPRLGFHLDSGHSKLERGYDRFEEYLDRLGHRLLHVHLSENDGSSDQHLPLGAVSKNATDWPRHIRMLKSTGYDGTITLEVFSSLKEHLLTSRDLLRRWWEEA